MDDSKQKVLNALKERNIDVNKIEKYLQKKHTIFNKSGCLSEMFE